MPVTNRSCLMALNTWFLANEHLNLKPVFDIPPCNLDNFQLCRGHALAQPLTTPSPDESDTAKQLAEALHRAEQAESQLHALQNCRTVRAVQKLRNVLRRA